MPNNPLHNLEGEVSSHLAVLLDKYLTTDEQEQATQAEQETADRIAEELVGLITSVYTRNHP